MPQQGFFSDGAPMKRVIEAALAVYRVTERIPASDPLWRMLREETLKTTQSIGVFFVSPSEENKTDAGGHIEMLCGYFFVAQQQNWVDAENFEVLAKEYRDIYSELAEPTQKYLIGENQKKGAFSKKDAESKLFPATKTPPIYSEPFSPEDFRIEGLVESTRGEPFSPEDFRIKGHVESISAEAPAAVHNSHLGDRQQKIIAYLQNRDDTTAFGDIAALFTSISKRTVRRDLDFLVRNGMLIRQGVTNASRYRVIRTV